MIAWSLKLRMHLTCFFGKIFDKISGLHPDNLLNLVKDSTEADRADTARGLAAQSQWQHSHRDQTHQLPARDLTALGMGPRRSNTSP